MKNPAKPDGPLKDAPAEGSVFDLETIEGKLQESRERMAAIFSTVQAGILVIDAEAHRIVDANPKALEMIGSSREQVVGSVCHKFICPAQEGMCPITDLCQCIDNAERELLTASGERVPILKTVATVRVADREYLVETFLDLTERKQADRKLRESEEKYRDLLENANDLIQSVAPDGTILFVNRAWREALGYSESEIEGLSIRDVIHPDCMDHCMDQFRELMSGKNIERLETTFVTRDGRSIELEGSVNCHIEDGMPVSSRGIFRDITERKRAEKLLEDWNRQLEKTVRERTRQLEDAQAKLIRTEKMAMIGDLVSGTAHELSNPIGGILNAVQVLSGDKRRVRPQSSPAEDLVWLEGIEKAARRCQDIVEDLKRFSDQSHSPFIGVDINQVLQESLEWLLERNLSPEVKLSPRFCYDLPEMMGDPFQLTRAFSNILDNARNALAEGGEITLATELVTAENGDAEQIRITFTDNGCGIPPENLGKLFDPFFTTRPVGQGTGLGLTVSYGIVKRHGGDIDVRSTAGKRTEVIVTLPLAPPEG